MTFPQEKKSLQKFFEHRVVVLALLVFTLFISGCSQTHHESTLIGAEDQVTAEDQAKLRVKIAYKEKQEILKKLQLDEEEGVEVPFKKVLQQTSISQVF